MEKSIFIYEKNNTGVTLKKFISGGETVEIPAHAEDAGDLTGLPVTVVGAECFKENGIMITSIIVPETVTILEHDAFAYCVSLQSLKLPESIEVLGADYLIASGLEQAYIPASVNTIDRPELIDREFIVAPDNDIFSTDGFGLYETRNGVKTLIAVNASDEREGYSIAPGTQKTAYGALRDISTVKSLEIPAELDMIDEGSLSFTGGRASGSYGFEEITVSPENKRFLIKYDCLCEKTDGKALKLIRYFGGKECALGDDVKRIGNGCFKNTRLEEITFTDTDLNVGDEAFSGCLLKYAHSADGDIFFGDEDQFTVEKFVQGFGRDGKLFDYTEYDEFLTKQYLTEPRIRMICSRLKNPVGIDEDVRNLLKRRLGDSMPEVIELLAVEHNCATLGDIGELGLFTAENIDEYIGLAGKLEEKEMTAWFMSYKNRNIGFKDELTFL